MWCGGARETHWATCHDKVTPSKTKEFLKSPCFFRSYWYLFYLIKCPEKNIFFRSISVIFDFLPESFVEMVEDFHILFEEIVKNSLVLIREFCSLIMLDLGRRNIQIKNWVKFFVIYFFVKIFSSKLILKNRWNHLNPNLTSPYIALV